MHDRGIAIDFDGTLSDWDTGQPMPGAREAVLQLIDWGYVPFIFTCRPLASPIVQWLKEHNFPALQVIPNKPLAVAYIDDRGIMLREWRQALSVLQVLDAEYLKGR